MKNNFLGMIILSSILFMGCEGDSVDELDQKTKALTPQSFWGFDPSNGVVPLPNDLLFNGTTDGTLAIPGEAEATDYTDPEIALGGLDGWSTTSPISIDVVLPTNADGEVLTIEPSSVARANAVRVFEATTSGPLSADTDCITQESTDALLVCKLGNELQYGTDFVTSVSGSKLVIVPLKPLKAAQSYIYAITSLIEDSEGNSVAASPTYNLLKMDVKTHPLATPEQLLLQAAVNSYEAAMAEDGGVDTTRITYSGLFTTQSVGAVNQTIKALMADQTVGNPYAPSFTTAPTGVSNGAGGILTLAQALGLSNVDQGFALANGTDLYQATLRLPIYGECSKDACLDGSGNPLISGRWMAQGDSFLAVLAALAADEAESGPLTLGSVNFGQQAAAQTPPIDPTAALANPTLLVGKNWVLNDGTTPVDGVKHITKYNPIPHIRSYSDIPVLITIPNTNSGQTKPADGWPMVIAMHGLGGAKESTYSFASTYTAQGLATISIDMPLHGARSFGLSNGSYAISATSDEVGEALGQADLYNNGNPLVFVNIESTLTTRDNFNQAVADHQALRLALFGFGAQSSLLDGTKVGVQGLSLGSIVGSSFAAIANEDLINPSDGSVISPNPYVVNALSLVAPAGGLAGSFAGSPTFKPELIASNTFQQILAEANTNNLQQGDPGYDELVAAVLAEFLPSFAFAVQTAIDSIDPINYGKRLADLNLPVHLIEVVGDGANNLPDQVLPNSVEGFTVSGTEPLISAINLNCVDGNNSPSDGSGVVRFTKGHHSSIVSSGEIAGVTDGSAAAATLEMQLQVVAFAQSAASGNAAITVTNSGIVQACN